MTERAYEIRAEPMAYRVESDGYYVLAIVKSHDEAAQIGEQWLDDPVTAVAGPYPIKVRTLAVNPEYGKEVTA